MADWTSSEVGKATPFGATLNRVPRGSSRGWLQKPLALPLSALSFDTRLNRTVPN